MSEEQKQVLIVGGGIQGLTLAYFFSQNPLYRVRVLEKEKTFYSPKITSYQPAGQIYSQVQTVITQNNRREWFLGGLSGKDENFKVYFKAMLYRNFWSFMWHSMKKKTEQEIENDADALNNLTKLSQKEWLRFIEKASGSKDEQKWYEMFSYRRHRIVYLSDKEGQDWEKYCNRMNTYYKKMDYTKLETQEEIAKAAGKVLEVVPHVKTYSKAWMEHQNTTFTVNPPKVAKRLQQELLDTGRVQLLSGQEISEITYNGRNIKSVRTKEGKEFEADYYIVAAQNYTPHLLRPLGISVPMIPLKGYTLYLENQEKDLGDISFFFLNMKSGLITKENGSFIYASFADINGDLYDFNKQRLEDSRKNLSTILGRTVNLNECKPWTGLRAYTPDELPLIGALRKYNNLFICTGLSMRGLSNSFGASKLLYEHISGKESEIPREPYSPSRFNI